ncbi:MAG: tryptophan 7-halogenase [Prochloraceae cyanobacterium]|nr:tryptophan 7-halogenase [Prochloraceae cyanobacterium]
MEKDNYLHTNSSKQVVIFGGGPAGTATAITLAARGVPTIVLEANPTVRSKIGEVLSANVKPLLNKMGLNKLVDSSTHLPCYGNRFLWGSSQPRDNLFIDRPLNRGWHLNRTDFETKLSQLSISLGVKWFWNCKLLEVRSLESKWEVLVQYRGKIHSLEANFLVDATGRKAKLARYLGRARKYYDRCVGLACYFFLEDIEHIPLYTHIEAVADGWWYAALLADRRLVTVFMTDGDLVERAWHQVEPYWQKLQQTKLIKTLFSTDRLPNYARGVFAKSAQTSCLVSPVGEGWLAVGDAAFAYDPISSYGISSAMGGGYYAGNAIADYLRGRQEAIPAYRMVTERAFCNYLPLWRYQYLQEQRWVAGTFWRRRHQQ